MGDSMRLLEGKTAVVTGCNRGIGKAIIKSFAENGVTKLFAIIRKENPDFNSYISELEETFGISVSAFYADFSEEEQVEAAAKQILSTKQPIDILVNNVGTSYPLRMFTMIKSEESKHVCQINYFSPILLTQILTRGMVRHKKGNVVFISSMAAYDAFSNLEYCASKGAINSATIRLAHELGNFGIRVNAVAPSLTDSGAADNMSLEDQETAISRNILHRKALPEEIADVVTYLSSDMASFITAQIIRVDGGLR